VSRNLDLTRPVPRARPLPANLSDVQWWADAEQRYEEYWRAFLGEPETLRTGAHWFYQSGEFGAAALMYQRSIDLLHTRYCFEDMRHRQPSAADLAIVDGYLNSLGASLSMHPDVPAADSIAEVAHRLEDIRATCKAAGIPADLYRNALLNLERYARRFGVHINTAVLAEPKPTVINNQGIWASGHAVVTGNAVAPGGHAHAAAFGAPQSQATPDQVSVLLEQFIAELARTGRPDRDDLAEVADEARRELAAPAPRLPRLRVLTKSLAAAVAGATSLAALAAQIEQAIHGL
jgi:hypothetical protein